MVALPGSTPHDHFDSLHKQQRQQHVKRTNTTLRRCLCQRLPNLISPRLLGDHHHETLEVVERPPLRDRLPLLRPARLLPLLDRTLLLKVLSDNAGTGPTRK